MTKDWNASVQAEIEDLYVNQKKILLEVKAIMERRHSFRASTRSYRMKLKEWGYLRANPRKATKDRSRPRSGDSPSEHSEDSEATPNIVDDSAMLDEAEDLIPAICPWTEASNLSTNIVMEMLLPVLESDSQKLESLVMANPDHVNYPIGLPFEAINGRFFNHPAIQQCVILQHPSQTLLDIASALPSSAVSWVLLSHGANGSTHPLGTDLALHNAIKNGRTYSVQSLLHSGRSNVNGLPGTTWRPLLQAAFWNVPDVVRLLLDRGANVNDNTPAGEGLPFKTALQLVLDRRAKEYDNPSARERCEKITKMLLAAGANIHLPSTEDMNGLSPFETFIQPWQGVMSWATSLTSIDMECLEAFVRKGADLQTHFDGFTCSSTTRSTFEHQVLWHSTPTLARLLVDHAAPSPEANGSNILHEIVGSCPDAKRHPADTLRDIEALLKRGADPNLPDMNGSTPLKIVVQRCPTVDIIPRLRALLDGGADPEPKDRNGLTPIIFAGSTFMEPMVSKVLEVFVAKYRGRYAQYGHVAWHKGYFPIPQTPTFAQVLGYDRHNAEFVEDIQRMLPSTVHEVFQKAAFNVASTRYLDGVTDRLKVCDELRFTADDKSEIQHVVSLRGVYGLEDYAFEQAFVMTLLMPESLPTRVLDDPPPTLSESELNETVAMLQEEISTSLSTSMMTNLPTPLVLETPEPDRRHSASSNSSTHSTTDFFVPETTQIKWSVNKWDNTRPGDQEKASRQVMRYKCKSCKGDSKMTAIEYQ
ncbi:ankyrin [Amniculicola lignicola CBS 123094]|uniref:Ankyrin n=1 Tax=Amniculicola lignicola CBS 123094 TaxID=1392246 RepID=A0A6A5WVC0_9PLEO|nr:ankyrin [Amniculicola lignicola CBS 123094]